MSLFSWMRPTTSPPKAQQYEEPRLDPSLIGLWMQLKNPAEDLENSRYRARKDYDICIEKLYVKINTKPFPYVNVTNYAKCTSFSYWEAGKRLLHSADSDIPVYKVSTEFAYEVISDKRLISKLNCLELKAIKKEQQRIVAEEKAKKQLKTNLNQQTLKARC